jgi:hypothetical protein
VFCYFCLYVKLFEISSATRDSYCWADHKLNVKSMSLAEYERDFVLAYFHVLSEVQDDMMK